MCRSVDVRQAVGHVINLVGAAEHDRRALGATMALPPACSMIMPNGLASYISRSLPLGDLPVGGYMNTPPFSRIRCTSATIAPT